MKVRITLGASLAAALLMCSALSAEEGLKSGPQVGSKKINVFNPLHCSGAGAGGRACLV
jgi:hypothetical protein